MNADSNTATMMATLALLLSMKTVQLIVAGFLLRWILKVAIEWHKGRWRSPSVGQPQDP